MKGLTAIVKRFRVEATLTGQASALLDQLVATGLHGRSRSEAVRRIVDRALESYVQPRFVVTGQGQRAKAEAR